MPERCLSTDPMRGDEAEDILGHRRCVIRVTPRTVVYLEDGSRFGRVYKGDWFCWTATATVIRRAKETETK